MISEGKVEEVLVAYVMPAEQMYAEYPRSQHAPARLSTFVAALRDFIAASGGAERGRMWAEGGQNVLP